MAKEEHKILYWQHDVYFLWAYKSMTCIDQYLCEWISSHSSTFGNKWLFVIILVLLYVFQCQRWVKYFFVYLSKSCFKSIFQMYFEFQVHCTVAPRGNELTCIKCLHITNKTMHLPPKSSHPYCSVYGNQRTFPCSNIWGLKVVFASQITD